MFGKIYKTERVIIGVTLVELAVVIIVLGFIAGAAIPRISTIFEDADAQALRAISAETEIAMTEGINRGKTFDELTSDGAGFLDDILNLIEKDHAGTVKAKYVSPGVFVVDVQSKGVTRNASYSISSDSKVLITEASGFEYYFAYAGDLVKNKTTKTSGTTIASVEVSTPELSSSASGGASNSSGTGSSTGASTSSGSGSSAGASNSSGTGSSAGASSSSGTGSSAGASSSSGTGSSAGASNSSGTGSSAVVSSSSGTGSSAGSSAGASNPSKTDSSASSSNNSSGSSNPIASGNSNGKGKADKAAKPVKSAKGNSKGNGNSGKNNRSANAATPAVPASNGNGNGRSANAATPAVPGNNSNNNGNSRSSNVATPAMPARPIEKGGSGASDTSIISSASSSNGGLNQSTIGNDSNLEALLDRYAN